MSKPDLYSILGCAPTATPEEVKTAYRSACKEHHPDAGGSPEQFVKLKEAYEVLSDPERRALYDSGGDWDGSQALLGKGAASIFVGLAEQLFMATALELHQASLKWLAQHREKILESQRQRLDAAKRLLRTAEAFPKKHAVRAALVARAAALEQEAANQVQDWEHAGEVAQWLEANPPGTGQKQIPDVAPKAMRGWVDLFGTVG